MVRLEKKHGASATFIRQEVGGLGIQLGQGRVQNSLERPVLHGTVAHICRNGDFQHHAHWAVLLLFVESGSRQ